MRLPAGNRNRSLPFMRFFLLTAALLALGTFSTASAAENGDITGRVVNQTTGKPAAGAEVTLGGADEDGSGRVRRTTTTGPDGTYRFDSLPTGPKWLYVIDARYDGGLFPGTPFQFPAGRRASLRSTLKVWNTTDDPNAVLVERDAMFVLPSENSVGVVESVTVVNPTGRAYIGRGGGQRGPRTSVGFDLPNGAGDLSIQDASMDIPELVATDFGFGITVALPPGESTFAYSYRVPAEVLTYVLSKTMLYPTADFLLFAGEPLKVSSDRLEDKGTVTLEGETYRRWEVPGLVDAGDTVLIQATAEASVPWWPLAAGGGALLAVGAGIYLFKRRRRPIAREVPREVPRRDDLVAEIASLDLAYEAGELQKDEWESRRSRLKTELLELAET